MIYFWTLRMISDNGGDDEVEFYDNPTSQEIEETCRDYVIEYYMPDEWCSHCESDSHDWDKCKHNEDDEDDEDE